MGERPGMAEDAESEVLQGPESGGLGVCEECSYVLLHSILLVKLESHVSRETPKTLIMPERHQGNAVLTFYFWP